MAKRSDEVMVAIESGTAMIGDTELSFTKDTTRVPRSHPLVKAQPHCFSPAEDGLTYDVERATAEPGEKRGE